MLYIELSRDREGCSATRKYLSFDTFLFLFFLFDRRCAALLYIVHYTFHLFTNLTQALSLILFRGWALINLLL
jgi:hypothetical protein